MRRALLGRCHTVTYHAVIAGLDPAIPIHVARPSAVLSGMAGSSPAMTQPKLNRTGCSLPYCTAGLGRCRHGGRGARGGRGRLDRALALLGRRALGRDRVLELDEQRVRVEQRGGGAAAASFGRHRLHRARLGPVAGERDGDGELVREADGERARRPARRAGRELGVSPRRIGLDRQRGRRRLGRKEIHARHRERTGGETEARRHHSHDASGEAGSLPAVHALTPNAHLIGTHIPRPATPEPVSK